MTISQTTLSPSKYKPHISRRATLHHASHSHYFVEDQPRMSGGGHLA